MNTVIFPMLFPDADHIQKSNMPGIMCDYSKFDGYPYMIKGTNETLPLKGTVKLSITEGMEKEKKNKDGF